MKNRKRSKILLKVIERFYKQHPDIRESINTVIAEICREENTPPEKVFLLLFIIMDCFRKNLGNRIFRLPSKQRMSILRVDLKRSGIFSSDHAVF